LERPGAASSAPFEYNNPHTLMGIAPKLPSRCPRTLGERRLPLLGGAFRHGAFDLRTRWLGPANARTTSSVRLTELAEAGHENA